MKILHFLDTLNRGGAETQALDVCRNAEAFGLEVTFVTAQGGAMEEDFLFSGAEYIRLDRRFPVDIYLASQLRRIIRERDIQIVHSYQPVEALHLYLATRGLKNVKQVLSFQGFFSGKKNRLTARLLASRMDANISVSRSLFGWLREKIRVDTSKNFYLIYNGADKKRLESSGKSLKEELNLDENTRLIGMIANFMPQPTKDHLTVCRALPEVFAEAEDAHFVFVGRVTPGAEEKFESCARLCQENGIAERVHFLGAREDVADILAQLDLFVLSSLSEGLPLAAAEAMLAGVPLIVSDIEPLLEIAGNGKYAETFPAGDAEILSGKILKLLENESLRKDLAKEALAFAEENFSIEAHLKNLKMLYENLLEEDKDKET